MDTDTLPRRKRTRVLSYAMPGPIPYRIRCLAPNHLIRREETGSFYDRLNRLVTDEKGHRHTDRVFLPQVQHMSARRAPFSEFRYARTLAGGTELYECSAPSDLVAVRRRQGVFFPAAGCLFVVATGDDYCLMGHAGRDSLVRLPGNDREPESVVHTIAESFDRKGIARSNIMIRAFFGIETDAFVHDPHHPVRGSYNQEVLACADELQVRTEKKARRLAIKQWTDRDKIVRVKDDLPRLSLFRLLKAQAILLEIYNVGCEKPLPTNGDFACTRHTNEDLVQKRNWVFAYRE